VPLTSKFKSLSNGRFGWLLNVLFFVAVFVGVSAFQMRNMLSPSGDLSPELSGPLLRGGNYDIADIGEKPALVYFFAPWCKICGASADNLARLRRLRDENSLEILAVALDWQNVDEVRQYVERHEIDLPVLLGGQSVTTNWKIYAFPTYYVLDSERHIRRRDLGYSTQLGLWWRTWLVD
jgi:thiol-disulfide isomerase/thioredoxin